MEKYIILKGRVRSDSLNFYGVFVLIIDRDLKILDKLDVVASRIPTLFNTVQSETWDSLQKAIIQNIFDGKNIDNLSKSITMAIDKLFLNEDVDYLINLIENDMTKFITIFEENLNRTFQKGNIKVEIFKNYAQTLETQKKFEEDISQSIAGLDNSLLTFDIPPGVSVIPVKPVLAPVSGTPIYELQNGDNIYVNLDPNFDKYREYVNYFNLKQDDKILPIKAQILEILIDLNNNFVILVKLDDTTYGQIIEEEKVKIRKVEEKDFYENINQKIKMYDPQLKYNEKKAKRNNSAAIVLFGIAILLIIVLIILLFT
ncbi:MAG: hypothetical protein N3A58_03775 [Spirochaetes bacterium]|nr:hypothetical protein [Spirochaetota bacterium]